MIERPPHRQCAAALCRQIGQISSQTASADIMPKLLAKQHLNIRLIVNHSMRRFMQCPHLASNMHPYLKWKNL